MLSPESCTLFINGHSSLYSSSSSSFSSSTPPPHHLLLFATSFPPVVGSLHVCFNLEVHYSKAFFCIEKKDNYFFYSSA